jgi:hypothetical protein
MIKFEELTLGEIEEIELMLNSGFDTAFTDGKPKGRALRILTYIFKRRLDPAYKFEDTEKLTQKEALEFLTADAKKE